MRETLKIKKLNKDVNSKMRKFMLTAVLAAFAIMATASLAFAAHGGFQGNPQVLYQKTASQAQKEFSAATNCIICHTAADSSAGLASSNRNMLRTMGPHGGYTTTTRRCAACHVIHSNVADNGRTAPVSKLLPGQTVTGVCNFCHDLTGSEMSAYATYYLTSADQVKSAHYVEGATKEQGQFIYLGGEATGNINAPTNGPLRMPGDVIPGGDIATGGTLLYAGIFKEGDWSKNNSTKQFTCDSCHTPHGIEGQTVNAFFGESQRKVSSTNVAPGYTLSSSRLLKNKLTVSGDTYSEYGSAWCAGCHQGRLTMAGPNNNHPVNTGAAGYNLGKIALKTVGASSAEVTSFAVYGAQTEASINAGLSLAGNKQYGLFSDKAILFSPTTSGTQTLGKVTLNNSDRFMNRYPQFNSWFAMTSGDALNSNAPRPDGYIPISEFQSDTSGVNGPACQQCHASTRDVEASFADNLAAGMHITFPHLGTSQYLLVEQNTDDLCTNCHGLDNLP